MSQASAHAGGLVDLLPLGRRVRRARREAVAGWIVAGVLVAVASIAPAGAMALAARDGSDDVARRVARSERLKAQFEAEAPRLKGEIQRLQRRDAVLRQVEDRADWRGMLGAIAEIGEGVRFERVECNADRVRGQLTVSLIGLTESLPQAQGFVLRMEGLEMFDNVTLESTSRVVMPAKEITRFEVRATRSFAGGGK